MPDGYEVDEVWKARGRGFQMATIQSEGKVIHFTGQVAWTKDERVAGVGDVELQTRACFENIRLILQAVGGELSDIVAITTYYTDQEQLPKIQKVRSEVFEPGVEPVSTSIMVAGLGNKDFLVELTPVAVIPWDRFKEPNSAA